MSVFGGLRIPLFTSGEVGSRIAEARAAFRAADATAHEARRSAEKDLVSARAALEAAESRLKAFIEAEAAAKRAREIQQARYEEGAARLADLLDSRAAELRARLGASTARSERAVAEASLQLALGLPPEGKEIP
jgi:outer membrane protein TolC